MTTTLIILIFITIGLIITTIQLYIIYNKYEKSKAKIYILEKRNAEQINFYNHIIKQLEYKDKKMQEDIKKYRLYKKWYEHRKKSIRNKQIIEE